jgi:AraC family transcriptional regulator
MIPAEQVAAPSRPPPLPDHLISVAELPIWVPGQITSASDDLGWKDVAQRSYRYQGQDVEIPPMSCFMIVCYREGGTPMDRRIDGRWTRTTCEPGHFSLLSRSADSHWHWTQDIEVSHVYLTQQLMCRVASEVQGKEVVEVLLHDVLRGFDPVVGQVAEQVRREAMQRGMGGPLYVEALSVQLAVHLLRHYATCKFKPGAVSGGLSTRELARLEAYVDAHLHCNITLEDVARALGLEVWTLNRRLRATLRTSAFGFVLERRLRRACELLRAGDLAIKEIAAATGFADQAHMTRMFRARLGVTPRRYRDQW